MVQDRPPEAVLLVSVLLEVSLSEELDILQGATLDQLVQSRGVVELVHHSVQQTGVSEKYT